MSQYAPMVLLKLAAALVLLQISSGIRVFVPSAIQLKRNGQNILRKHNAIRANHGAAPLRLNSALSKHAQKAANRMARNNRFEHTKNLKHGENLYMGFTTNITNIDNEIIEMMNMQYTNEERVFNYNRPGFSPRTGHFTAIVWKATTKMGVGIAMNKDKLRWGRQWFHVYIATTFLPQGNIIGGAFRTNVQPPRVRPTLATTAATTTTTVRKRRTTTRRRLRRPPVSLSADKRRVQLFVASNRRRAYVPSRDAFNYLRWKIRKGYNQLRAKHRVTSLMRQSSLDRIAQAQAQHLAKVNLYANYVNNTPYSMMMYQATTNSKESFNLSAMFEAQYNAQLKLYNFNQPGFANNTAQLTQILWKESRRLGIGIAMTLGRTVLSPPTNAKGATTTTARPVNTDAYHVYCVTVFDPKGNYGDAKHFRKNVPPPRSN